MEDIEYGLRKCGCEWVYCYGACWLCDRAGIVFLSETEE